MNYLIALDLDGTLTNERKEITPRTKDVLMRLQRQGARLCLASGRPPYGMRPLAEQLHIPFYEDVCSCHTKQRMNAVFSVNVVPKEQNIICFDDFVTTGQTLHSMKVALVPYNKNLIFFAGINNKL